MVLVAARAEGNSIENRVATRSARRSRRRLAIAHAMVDKSHGSTHGQANDEEHQAVGKLGFGHVSEHLGIRLGK